MHRVDTLAITGYIKGIRFKLHVWGLFRVLAEYSTLHNDQKPE